MLGAGFLLVMLLMVGLWIFYLFQGDAGVVDIGWGVGFMLTAWSYFFLGSGNMFKMLTISIMATIWAVRLTVYIFQRYIKREGEDPRYKRMRENWGGSSNFLFLMIYIFQGALINIISLPFLLVGLGSNDQWSLWELWGIVIWLIGILGESLADSQMAAFNSEPANKGKVCQRGLWRFSRHPNYFFEAIVWIGFCVFAIPSTWGGLAVISPIVMLTLLVKISGIPLAESESLRTKGDLYREYQSNTSAFIPWFPNK